jgi:hypothetical protein
MITAMQLREHMNESPFRPFRVTLSDGRAFNVPNHDVAHVKRNSIEIGFDLDSRSFPRKYVDGPILHITRIEDVPTAQAA